MSAVKTFWSADEKIPISQRHVAVPSDNNLSYSGGQKVVISVPPTVEYFNPVNSYLEFDAIINLPAGRAPTRLQLDKTLGGSVLIRDIRIIAQSSGGGAVLEELQDVNCLASIKADYYTNENERQKRALVSGATTHSLLNNSNLGAIQSQGNNHRHNPYYRCPEGTDGVTYLSTGGANSYFGSATAGPTNTLHKTKLQIKLESGIFQNSKIFPCKMLGGLQITLILEDNNRIFRQLDTVSRNWGQSQNPIFGGAKSANTVGYSDPLPVHDGSANDAGGVDFILMTPSNSMFGSTGEVDAGALQCPFCLGETIGLKNNGEALTDADYILVNPANNVIFPKVQKITATTVGVIIELDQKVLIKAGGTQLPGIGIVGTDNINKTAFLYSTSTQNNVDYNPTITISDVNLMLEEVIMPEGYTRKMMTMMKEGGQLTYDFTSFTTYKQSQQASDRVGNIRLGLMNRRCRSILCVPTDSSVIDTANALFGCKLDTATGLTTSYTYQERGAQNTGTAETPVYGAVKANVPRGFPQEIDFSERTGLVGVADNITDYQFFYDGKLNPNREVKCSKTSSLKSIDQQLCVEQEKSLSSAGIPCLSFYNFQKNFFIGRSFALGNNTADVRNKDFNLQINYRETLTSVKPKMWNSFVAHIRRIIVRGDDITVEL